MKIAIAIVAVVAVLAAISGYWLVTSHQRASMSTVVNKVSSTQHASNVTCVKRDSNGAVWLCVGSVSNQPTCFAAHVSTLNSVFGGMTIHGGGKRCNNVPALKSLLSSNG
jgi:hypothetical protein